MSLLQKYPEQDSDSGGLNGSMIDYLSAILYGGKCLQYSELTVDDAAIVDLTDAVAVGVGANGLPAAAKACLIVVEAGATEADAARVVRFRQDGGDPSATEGMPVGDNGSFEIKGGSNLANFKVIGITAGKTHTLRIEFYGAG